MNLQDFYYSELQCKSERVDYAMRIGFSPEYVRIHLIPPNSFPDRMPPLPKLRKIAEETKGKVSFDEVEQHFSKGADPDNT